MAALTMSMAAAKPALVGSSKSAFKGSRVSAVAPKKVAGGRATLQVRIDAADDAARAPRRTPSDATDATRTIATRALTQRGDPVTVITPSASRTARGPASETRQSVPFQGPASRAEGYPDRATHPRATRGDARARVPTTRRSPPRRRSSPRSIRGSPFSPDARSARVTPAPAFALREGFPSTSG